MHFKTEQKGFITEVILTGRIEPKNEEDLYAFLSTLLHSEKKYLIVNLEEVLFLSTGGLRAFLRIHHDCTLVQGKIIFCKPSTEIANLLVQAHLNEELISYETMFEAENSIKAEIGKSHS
jgi:anti-anti-sigma factor